MIFLKKIAMIFIRKLNTFKSIWILKLKILIDTFGINKDQINLFHLKSQLCGNFSKVVTDSNSVNDEILVKRIILYYRMINKFKYGDSMWSMFFENHHSSVHKVLMIGDTRRAQEIFREPEKSDIFYGFDILTKSFNRTFDSKKNCKNYAVVCLDGLVRFAESTGVIPIAQPETWLNSVGKKWQTELLLSEIRKKCWPFSIPNPFPNEYGLKTSRGVISYRVPQALYQAWRIKQLVKHIKNPRILEIGPGLGRTAYYAYELGIRNYTLIDVPISSACQAYFLGRSLGHKKIHLGGEKRRGSVNKIKILPPDSFMTENNQYDLIFNADSLTEMDINVSRKYWEKIKKSTKIFLSINHEINTVKVNKLISKDLNFFEVIRYPYWMRKGYVEEIIVKK